MIKFPSIRGVTTGEGTYSSVFPNRLESRAGPLRLGRTLDSRKCSMSISDKITAVIRCDPKIWLLTAPCIHFSFFFGAARPQYFYIKRFRLFIAHIPLQFPFSHPKPAKSSKSSGFGNCLSVVSAKRRRS